MNKFNIENVNMKTVCSYIQRRELLVNIKLKFDLNNQFK